MGLSKLIIITTVIVMCIIDNEILSLTILLAGMCWLAYKLLRLATDLEEGNAWKE